MRFLRSTVAHLPGFHSATGQGALWMAAARIVNQISLFARIAIVARVIGPHDLGLIGMALIINSTLDALTEPGFTYALIQRQGHIRGYFPSVFTFQIFRGGALAVITALSAAPVSSFLHQPNLIPVIRAIAVVPLIQGFTSPETISLQRMLRFKPLFFWNLAEALAGLCSAFALVMVFQDIWSMILSMIIASAVRLVASFAVAPWRIRIAFDLSTLRSLGNYGRWVTATNVIVFLSMQGDNAFVAKFLGATALGIYQIAFKTAQIPVEQLGFVASRVAFPSLSAMANEPKRFAELYSRITSVLLIVNAGICLALVMGASPIIDISLGEQWSSAVPLLRILAIAGLFRSIMNIGGYSFFAIGVPRLNFLMNCLRFGVFAAAVYPLARLYGAEGVAFAVLVSFVGMLPFYLSSIKRTVGISTFDHIALLSPAYLRGLLTTTRPSNTGDLSE